MICDENFLKKVQNNHLELKVWETNTRQTEKLVGSAKIPLHQFYIAFRDRAMIDHLSFNQLPIISIDAYTNFISPLSNELYCQAKILLAIGSNVQIEYLKFMRKLNTISLPSRVNPQGNSSLDSSASKINAKSKLTDFIESLSQNFPESQQKKALPSPSSSQPQLRKTSDLLETLKKALSQPPPQSMTVLEKRTEDNILNTAVESDSSSSGSIFHERRVNILITVEHANHLPKVVKKRQNRRKNKSGSSIEFDPSAYATFDSSLETQKFNETSLPEYITKSHEGLVYCTKVIKSVDPQWNESYDVELPLDILTNSQKRFVVKVWRKCSQESDMKPAPFEDAVIGFTAVDLSVLLTGLPVLSGYYSITDFSGKNHGQIKLSFKTSENLAEYQNRPFSPSPGIKSLLDPINIDVDGSNLLSRTLKRKFTELDEITQRLKARLFDVTGDENFDPDEEFEKDLNTEVDDEMNDDENFVNFGWLKNDSNGNVYNFLQPSTSKSTMGSSTTIPTQRPLVSGCSNVVAPTMVGIDHLLNKYDLDTLINPKIFKNILDPSSALSEETPTLKEINNVDISGNSGDTTISSIISIDQVNSIEKALQEASIADLDKNLRNRGDGKFSE